MSEEDQTSSFISVNDETPTFEAEPQEQPTEEAATSKVVETEEVSIEAETEIISDEAEVNESESDEKKEEDAPEEHEKAKKPSRVQKRINKITREKEDAKREVEALKRQLQEATSKKEGDENFDEYLDAEEKPATEEKPEQVEDNSKEPTDSQKTAMAVIKELVEVADKPDDYEKVAYADDVQITGEMLEALAECDDPAKIIYHLGQNKDIAAEIASGSTVQQMRRIAQLELSIGSKPEKPVKQTKAPTPISPVKASDSQQKPVSKMSFSEFEDYQNKKERGKKNTW